MKKNILNILVLILFLIKAVSLYKSKKEKLATSSLTSNLLSSKDQDEFNNVNSINIVNKEDKIKTDIAIKSKISNSMSRLNKSTSEINNNNKNNYIITSLESSLFINENETDGLVTEIVSFSFAPGKYNTILRKISNNGTSDSLTNFKLISSDVQLINAKVIKNCREENITINNSKNSISSSTNGNIDYSIENQSLINNYLDKRYNRSNRKNSYNSEKNSDYKDFYSFPHSYICVVASIEEIEFKANTEIIIGYEYRAIHVLKKREKPFSNNDEQENVLIWNVFNNNYNDNILKIDFSVRLKTKLIDREKITMYPEINSKVS